MDYREYLSEKFDEIRRGQEEMARKIDTVISAHAQISTSLVRLETKQAQLEKDVNSLANNNRIQHLEFYANHKETNDRINKAGIEDMKNLVVSHDTELDKLKGAFKLGAWVIGFIFAVISAVMGFIK